MTVTGTAYRSEAPDGLMMGRRKAPEREARDRDLYRRKVEDQRLKNPRVDPRVEAEARVDPLRKANLKELYDHCPTKGLDPRMALGRRKVKLKISPKGAEMRGAEPASRRKEYLEEVWMKPKSLLEEVQ